jgi:drug/metabolite transporter (DMT)-like permease
VKRAREGTCDSCDASLERASAAGRAVDTQRRHEIRDLRMSGIVCALLAALLFGASTPACKRLLDALEPTQLAGLLYLGAALATAPSAILAGRSHSLFARDRASRLQLAGAVLAGGVLGPLLLLFALRLALAGSVSLWLNLELVATSVLGVLFFREHLGRLAWIGVAGSVLAGAIVAWDGGWPGFLACSLTAAACVCWGLDNHLTARIDGITPAQSTFAKGIVAGGFNLALGALAAPFRAEPAEIASALLVGVLSYGLSIPLYIRAAHVLGATRAQGIFASAPFAGAALAFALLGEPLSLAHAGAALLLAASIWALVASRHLHPHLHGETEHVHSHRHDDDHHLHEHPGQPHSLRHSHRHRHESIAHAHPHWPDLHHRHEHES